LSFFSLHFFFLLVFLGINIVKKEKEKKLKKNPGVWLKAQLPAMLLLPPMMLLVYLRNPH